MVYIYKSVDIRYHYISDVVSMQVQNEQEQSNLFLLFFAQKKIGERPIKGALLLRLAFLLTFRLTFGLTAFAAASAAFEQLKHTAHLTYAKSWFSSFSLYVRLMFWIARTALLFSYSGCSLQYRS